MVDNSPDISGKVFVSDVKVGNSIHSFLKSTFEIKSRLLQLTCQEKSAGKNRLWGPIIGILPGHQKKWENIFPCARKNFSLAEEKYITT